MSGEPEGAEVTRLRRECDLYLRLLKLGAQNELEPFLKEALGLIVDVVGAHQGYLELHQDDEVPEKPRWWIAHGFTADEIEVVRSAISGGIVAESLATGRTIMTPSALLDPRFRDRGSVRYGKIEAVICAPVGEDPPIGVLYLQRRAEPGPFAEEDRAKVEIFAHHLAPFADRLLARQRTDEGADPTRPFRETLRLDSVIGRSPALAALFREVAMVAPLEVSILLTGESGTGKSQIAHVIHDNGPRRSRPLVELNCATIPESLLESELFGALPGAHSTATRRIEGKVAAAEGGTLLLDEVGELSFSAQAKLLQLLQSKSYYPLGSAKPVQANVRLIAATNADLQAAVRDRRFREDLLYRLQVLPVRVPTLAERRDDIAPLAEYFCAAACERHHLSGATLARDALRALQAAEWPGNIRQLAHAIEAGVIRAAGAGATRVLRTHIFPEPGSTREEQREGLTFQEATRRFQARLLRETIEDTGWNIVETARRLELARSHVYNLIRAFGIERERS